MPSTSRPRRPLTGRAMVLGAVVVLLVVVLASPLHRFLASRTAVDQAAAQLQQDTTQLAQLQQQRQQWSDPAYVAQQARQRLQYAMPGDRVYQVARPGQQSTIQNSAPVDSAPRAPGDTWSRRLWGSVQAADGSSG